ncbi:hypothetical protein GCM10009547_28350 [Sporichthya brevicatena]|uniref:Uncharacterized protein n=1 Tax=Sporichthya brevicatena TaxID=171442 RepID=A0ABN1GYG9_9ACTN
MVTSGRSGNMLRHMAKTWERSSSELTVVDIAANSFGRAPWWAEISWFLVRQSTVGL